MLLSAAQLQGLRGRIALDIENDPTPNMRPAPGHLLGLGIWSPDNDLFGYYPVRSAEDLRLLQAAIRTWKRGSFLIAHNAKYEMRWLGFTDWHLARFEIVDTMVAEHMLAEELTLDLGSCEARRLKRRTKRQILNQIEQDTGLTIKQVASWPVRWVAEYCINDCRITYELAALYYPMLRRERLQDLFLMAMRYLKALYRAEERGLLVSKDQATVLQGRIEHLREQGMQLLAKEVGRPQKELPNLNSPKQLSDFLYKELRLRRPTCPPELEGSPKAKKFQTSTGTDAEILEMLEHPAARLIVQIKKLGKVESYLNSYKKLGEPVSEGWIVRPSLNQTGTITGRLSSSKPNIQQVSAKPVGKALDPSGKGLMLRHVFKARKGYRIVGIDYKQMEVVGFAMLSKEPTMLKLVRQKADMHDLVADLLFGAREDPSEHHPKRYYTKSINFGLLYGLGDGGLAKMLGESLERTVQLKNQYLATFSRVRGWMMDVNKQLEHQGFVRYWSGRKRRISDSKFYYRGVNALVQGGCADILMHATVRVDEYLRSVGDGYMLAPVHDELVFELPEDRLDEMIPRLREIMSVPDLLGVPFGTDVAIGQVWDETAA